MLFSNEEVARFINRNFEPCWQSVRPVPMVTIDFGNGQVIKRTLHGNVATYACNSDGQVLDVLPGIYEPKTYLQRLGELTDLHRFVKQSRRGDAALSHYHVTQADALKQGKPRARFVEQDVNRYSIIAVEKNVKLVLQPAQRLQARAAVARGSWQEDGELGKVDSPQELAGWKALAEDTRVNETLRRRKIHEHLAKLDRATPHAITKWLYREVLHADLDDPYLGLGKILFDSYPFSEEDGS